MTYHLGNFFTESMTITKDLAEKYLHKSLGLASGSVGCLIPGRCTGFAVVSSFTDTLEWWNDKRPGVTFQPSMQHPTTKISPKSARDYPKITSKMSFSPDRMSKSKFSRCLLTKGLFPAPLTPGCLEEHAKPHGGRDATVQAWFRVGSYKASEYTNLQFTWVGLGW